MPATAAAMRLADPFNPLEAVRASAALLRELMGNSAISASPLRPTMPGPSACRIGSPSAATCRKRRATTCSTSPALLPSIGRASRPLRLSRSLPRSRASVKPASWPPTGLKKSHCRRWRMSTATPDKAVVAVASLSQKRKGAKPAPAANQPIQLASADKVQVKVTKGDAKTTELKLVKPEKGRAESFGETSGCGAQGRKECQATGVGKVGDQDGLGAQQDQQRQGQERQSRQRGQIGLALFSSDCATMARSWHRDRNRPNHGPFPASIL